MNESLNRRIAILAGYRAVNIQPEMLDGWVLLRPDGSEVWWADGYGSLHSRVQTENSCWYNAPDFEHSLDATESTLPIHFSVEIAATRNGELSLPYEAILRDWLTDTAVWYWHGTGATRQEAAAKALEAYLLWKADQKS